MQTAQLMRKPDQRAAARRTALVLGLVALGIYIAFIMSGVIGQ
jgi:hypothetical protein